MTAQKLLTEVEQFKYELDLAHSQNARLQEQLKIKGDLIASLEEQNDIAANRISMMSETINDQKELIKVLEDQVKVYESSLSENKSASDLYETTANKLGKVVEDYEEMVKVLAGSKKELKQKLIIAQTTIANLQDAIKGNQSKSDYEMVGHFYMFNDGLFHHNKGGENKHLETQPLYRKAAGVFNHQV